MLLVVISRGSSVNPYIVEEFESIFSSLWAKIQAISSFQSKKSTSRLLIKW